MPNSILKRREGAVLVLTLNRADKKNALTGDMYVTLTAALKEANEEEEIRSIAILGQPGIFCAGNDIKDFIGFALSGSLGAPVLGFLKALATNTRPIVAGVDGAAIGIGTTLILHCDYALCSERAMFQTPFVDLALVPEAGSSLIVPELMGHRLAFELLVMGAKFDAKRAAETGLVNRITTAEALEAETLATAAAIAAKPREAVAISRRLLKGDPERLIARIEAEAKEFAQRLNSAEARAAFEAFLARGK